ncbi:MAG: HNH endonuclease [Candidatus Brocadiaceae bacterium]|jgi:5-methylcytosine-specific restriction endonuclease McrA
MSRASLQSSVLVLNRSFVPVHIVTARRAFGMLFKAVAEVVQIEDGRMGLYDFENWREISEFKRKNGLVDEDTEWVSTISFDIAVPRIVRLLFYNRFPKRRVSLNRRNLFARDENRCQYCGRKFSSSELSIDHVIPLSLGGQTEWSNVVCACTDCNKRKGGRTPREADMRLTRRPFQPKFNPMIRLKLRRRKYYSWRQFLDEAYWSVTLR